MMKMMTIRMVFVRRAASWTTDEVCDFISEILNIDHEAAAAKMNEFTIVFKRNSCKVSINSL